MGCVLWRQKGNPEAELGIAFIMTGWASHESDCLSNYYEKEFPKSVVNVLYPEVISPITSLWILQDQISQKQSF